MAIELSTVLALLILSGVVTTSLGVYAWNHRAMPGAIAFALLMFDATLWTVANALEMAGTSLPTKLFWANLQYLCYATIPLLWLILALEFSGLEHLLNPRRVSLLLIIPAITNLLVWTDLRYELVRQNFHLDWAGPFPVIAKNYGPWWFVHSIFSYLVMAAAFLIILRAMLRASSQVYRKQAAILLVGLGLPLLWNILYVTGLSPVTRHDLAPTVLGLSGLLVTWGLFRFRLFDILPIAQDAILKSISDGIVVFNAGGQVVAINPAARCLLDWPAASVIGRPGTELFHAWPELIELILDGQPAQLDFAFHQAGSIRYFDLSLAPLSDRFNQPLGQLLILHDITERKKAEEELRSLSQTDPLTGLFNRRRFFEVLQREIIRARRYTQPLSLMMIDVDSLKSVNDRFGHSAGDEVLRQVAGCIQPTRATDLVARVGGDEFALLLPETHTSGAEQVAWRLLKAARGVQLDFDAAISMSLGIAQLEPADDEQGESLLARADKAMYRAKRGRLGCAVAKELTQPVRR